MTKLTVFATLVFDEIFPNSQPSFKKLPPDARACVGRGAQRTRLHTTTSSCTRAYKHARPAGAEQQRPKPRSTGQSVLCTFTRVPTASETTTTPAVYPQECPCFESPQKSASCWLLFVMLTRRQLLEGSSDGSDSSSSTTNVCRYGPGRDAAPHRSTGTEYGQGTRRRSGRILLPRRQAQCT